MTIFSDTHTCSLFHLNLLPAYVNWQRHSCSILKMTLSCSIKSTGKSTLFWYKYSYSDPLLAVGLLLGHWQSHACQRLLWNKLVSGKEQPSPQKPLSISIKLHCYAFNKGSLRTAVLLWLFFSCAKSAHSIFHGIWTMEPNRVGHVLKGTHTLTVRANVFYVFVLCVSGYS